MAQLKRLEPRGCQIALLFINTNGPYFNATVWITTLRARLSKSTAHHRLVREQSVSFHATAKTSIFFNFEHFVSCVFRNDSPFNDEYFAVCFTKIRAKSRKLGKMALLTDCRCVRAWNALIVPPAYLWSWRHKSFFLFSAHNSSPK